MSSVVNPKSAKSKPNYAFIDSQNLNLGIQKAGWKMDWKKFRNYLHDKHDVKVAYLFIGYMAENEAMYEQLHDAGYLIVLKPTVGMLNPKREDVNKKPESENKQPIKGNIDAELVLYAMKEMPNYKKAVIVSGDGDFYCLAEYLAKKKRLLHIMTPNWQYSSLLKPYEKYLLRLDKLQKLLEHRSYKKKKTTQ